MNIALEKMGCLQSKKDAGDIHPNVFRVINIDENGARLLSGQLEVTDKDLILYREGLDATVWSLSCLRKYGYEKGIFSFEAGRRCESGEGIYAFRCRRARLLFTTLQHNISHWNMLNENMPFDANAMTDARAVPRHTLHGTFMHCTTVDEEQTDRITVRSVTLVAVSGNHHIMHNQRTATLDLTPGSPSSADILEVTPLNPLPQSSTNQVTNLYQVRDFKGRENNNNQDTTAGQKPHSYSNFNNDLTKLRTTLHRATALNTIRDLEDENHFRQFQCGDGAASSRMMCNEPPLSPSPSTVSEHYALLTIEQEASRQYMNLIPMDSLFISQDSGISAKTNLPPNTPSTPKTPTFNNTNLSVPNLELNTYENFANGSVIENIVGAKSFFKPSSTPTEVVQKFSESDTFASMSPVEELEVSYAVLDIDAAKDLASKGRDIASPESQSYGSSTNESTTSQASSQNSKLISQTSTEKSTTGSSCTVGPGAGLGYTTIDFDKTVALTSVASGTDVDTEGSRKTRHNSASIICTSPNGIDKTRAN